MDLIDSHAHLTAASVLPLLSGLLERAKKANIKRIVNICTDPASLREGLLLPSWISNAGATTPHDVEKEGASCFEIFAQAARDGKLVAIGETGLDFHYEHSKKEIQREYLKKYLRLAMECALPVIFHCREAFEELFAITDALLPKGYPAILHCFTGSAGEAKKCVERGWMVSFSGIVTFKKSEALREAAKCVPLEHLLLETDTPYLAPQSKRGLPNEPSYLPETAACLAAVKEIALAEMAQATTQNAENLFQF